MSDSNKVIDETFATKLAGRYLSFYLSKEEYCVDILKVQQIIQMDELTNVPLTPEYLCGVINLRGKIVPVLDLRIKFGMEVQENTEKTCIVILQVMVNNSPMIAGIVIDEVREVSQINADMISEVPEFGEGIDVTFLTGLAKIVDSVRMIIDIDKIFSMMKLTIIGKQQE